MYNKKKRIYNFICMVVADKVKKREDSYAMKRL